MRRITSLLTVLVTALAIGVPAAYAADQAGQAGSKTGSGWVSPDRLNVNTATVEQLAKVPGLNETTAKAIVQYREKNGPFTNFNQLQYVKGVDPLTLTKLNQYLLVVTP